MATLKDKLSNGKYVEEYYLENRIIHLNELLEPMEKWMRELKDCKKRLKEYD